MAELAICIRDKVNKQSLYLNCGLMKRGDVLTAQPDQFQWGIMELSDPSWVIVRVADLPLSEAGALCSPEPGFGRLTGSRTALKYAFGIDLEHETAATFRMSIAAAISQMQTPGPRSRPNSLGEMRHQHAIIDGVVTAADIRAWKRRKPLVDDPHVIGANPHVIG